MGYLSKEFNDVYSATEIREHEVLGLSCMFTTRFVSLVLSTTKDDEKAADPTEAKIVKERLLIRKRLLEDPNAMAFVIADSWLYAFGLCRQSLKRQSRKEAMTISTASIQRAMGGQDIGLMESIKSKLGMGRYRSVYVPKPEE